ncbi:hypothetical protein OA413_03875 [Pelagibacteraceae bacterium]|nr:hypothetical protein [Pelagibacteraceae bacterium]
MNLVIKIKSYFNFLCILYIFIITSFLANNAISNENIIINADEILLIDNGNKIKASGNITIKTSEFDSVSDNSTYDKELNQIQSSGNIIIKDNLNNHYYFDYLTTDKNFDSALGSNVKVRTSDNARIVGKSFSRQASNFNQINNASYTPCLRKNYVIKNCPGWRLDAKKVIHDDKTKTIYYENAVLKILNIPIIYTPFFSHPDPSVKKKSGILMPSISSDNLLGTSISVPLFYNIASNYDVTFTPTTQTKADDYYSLNYRHLTENHIFNLESSISSNESNTGTRNHVFIDGKVKNPYGEFEYEIKTSNNDTYLRKNQINDLTILTSGLRFTKEMKNSYLEFKSHTYKHLNNSSNQKWEYIYPSITYNIYNYNDPLVNKNWEVKNTFLNYRDINKNNKQEISSELISKDINVLKNIGLKFENVFQNRIIYFNDTENDFNQLRVFPQVSSKISYPLGKNDNRKSQILEPILMPIIATYNNYSNDQSVSNSNIFSLNRETSLSQWESGPRLNYGFNWLINYNEFAINTTAGQSLKLNKNSDEDSNEKSDYFITNIVDFKNFGYIKTDLTIDNESMYLKDNNINTSINIGNIKFGFDYDYESSNRIKTSEQISIGTKINLFKDTNFIASIRKDLMTEKSIGNAMGIHYENDCLAINFDYFRDFTAVADIKNSRGFSFTITLKPFGTSKQRGKTRNFGPKL